MDGKVIKHGYVAYVIGTLAIAGLCFLSRYSYLLFHSFAEIFSVVIAAAIFIIAWNSRKFIDNNYFLFIGISYLFVAFLDLTHTLSYKGMGVFPGYGPNLATQLWIITRYIESISLVIASFFINKKLKYSFLFLGYCLVAIVFLLSIFYWKNFPVCFIEGVGLTSFKIISEYAISAILLVSIFLLIKKRAEFDKSVLRLLIASIVITIFSELSFTLYTDVYGILNQIGHYFKIISFYLIYKALIETGFARPVDLLFKKLKESEQSLIEKSTRMELVNKELETSTLELSSANVKLKELDQLKSMFIASMSHELRTPLNSIIGFTGLILMGAPGKINSEQRKQLLMVKNSANHLLELITDVIDVSKIETKKIELFIEDFNLADLIGEIIESFKIISEKKGLKLSLDMPEKLLIRSDSRRIKQIIVNFISNAIKFTNKGGIVIKVEKQKDKVYISISDTGMGIKKIDIEKLFKQFSRIRLDSQPTVEGTGLGLYLSSKLTSLLGGNIKVSSEFGKGSIFTIILPLKYMEVKDEKNPGS